MRSSSYKVPVKFLRIVTPYQIQLPPVTSEAVTPILLLLALFFGLAGCTTPPGTQNYYISNSGNDTAPGTSPARAWKSLERINQAMGQLKAGDSILFRKGDEFNGQLLITKDSIHVASYGEGAKPVLSGIDELQGIWSKYNDSIYQFKLSKGREYLFGFLQNGKRLTLGKYPAVDTPYKGYSRYEYFENDTLIDKELTDRIDWTGAEIAVRAARWRMYRHEVLSHSGNQLVIDPVRQYGRPYTLGYYFINSPLVLKNDGDWAFVKKQGVVYLKTKTNPGKNIYTTPGIPKVFVIRNAAHVSVTGIAVTTGLHRNVSVENSTYIRIENCDILDGGGVGIFAENSPLCTFRNNHVHRMNFSGITTEDTDQNLSHSLLIEGNDVREIGLFDALFADGTPSNRFCGITVRADDCKIINNRVIHTGYTGIRALGRNTLVKRNYVDAINAYVDDGAAIYVNGSMNKADGTIIEENIVLNALGAPAGGPTLWGEPHTASEGIYIDDQTSGVTVKNNIIAHISHHGLFFKGNHLDTVSNCQITGNVFFNCENDVLLSGTFRGKDHYFKGASFTDNQIWDFDSHVPVNTLADTDFFWLTRDEPAIILESTLTDELYDIRPFSGNILITSQNETKPVNFQKKDYSVSAFNQDHPFDPIEHITLPADIVPSLMFLYNDTQQSKSFPLPAGKTYSDINKKSYKDQVVLDPFKAIVLIPR